MEARNNANRISLEAVNAPNANAAKATPAPAATPAPVQTPAPAGPVETPATTPENADAAELGNRIKSAQAAARAARVAKRAAAAAKGSA